MTKCIYCGASPPFGPEDLKNVKYVCRKCVDKWLKGD